MCGCYRLTAKERYLRDHFGLDEDPFQRSYGSRGWPHTRVNDLFVEERQKSGK